MRATQDYIDFGVTKPFFFLVSQDIKTSFYNHV